MAPVLEGDAVTVSKPPDGGWGWIVVIGAHISIGFAYSTPKALSIFFKDIEDEFNATNSEVAWLSSIMLAVMYAGGPVSSVLVDRYGSRPMVMIGGLMCGVSMVIASFGDSIVYLFIFISIIGGCGLCFNLNGSLNIISKYFLEKRPLANGLAMAGSPVFLSILAPLNQYLLDEFGLKGSLLILGGLILNCCVAGAVMRPVAPPKKPSSSAPQKKAEEQQSNDNTKLKESCLTTSKKFLDFSFFKDRAFVIYLIGNVLFLFGAYAPIMFLSAYAVSLNIGEYYAASLLSLMGFVDMFVRPATGLVANSKWVRPNIQYFLSFAVVFNGLCHLLCPLFQSFGLLVGYTVFFGMSFGMVFAVMFECLMDLMGSERFPRAVGLVTIIECIPMLLGPPTAGFLVDTYGTYEYLFIMCGSVILTGGVFLLVMNFYNYHMLKKENPNQDSVSELEMKQPPQKNEEENEAQRDPNVEKAGTSK